VILGNYEDSNSFHKAVRQAASDEVVFLGAIYDKAIVQSLRFHSTAYIHGHQVGGTNPSLVEALGAGNAVIAHDNRFNRWVAGPETRYFKDAHSFDALLSRLLSQPDTILAMSEASKARFRAEFTWAKILGEYEQLLLNYHPSVCVIESAS
jgi:glycosyltransferase involved in cell wall biosynthesis